MIFCRAKKDGPTSKLYSETSARFHNWTRLTHFGTYLKMLIRSNRWPFLENSCTILTARIPISALIYMLRAHELFGTFQSHVNTNSDSYEVSKQLPWTSHITSILQSLFRQSDSEKNNNKILPNYSSPTWIRFYGFLHHFR